jgi:hypothetical protein
MRKKAKQSGTKIFKPIAMKPMDFKFPAELVERNRAYLETLKKKQTLGENYSKLEQQIEQGLVLQKEDNRTENERLSDNVFHQKKLLEVVSTMVKDVIERSRLMSMIMRQKKEVFVIRNTPNILRYINKYFDPVNITADMVMKIIEDIEFESERQEDDKTVFRTNKQTNTAITNFSNLPFTVNVPMGTSSPTISPLTIPTSNIPTSNTKSNKYIDIPLLRNEIEDVFNQGKDIYKFLDNYIFQRLKDFALVEFGLKLQKPNNKKKDYIEAILGEMGYRIASPPPVNSVVL